ncbi:unnamed protein product, partial [Mycena citricolor]
FRLCFWVDCHIIRRLPSYPPTSYLLPCILHRYARYILLTLITPLTLLPNHLVVLHYRSEGFISSKQHQATGNVEPDPSLTVATRSAAETFGKTHLGIIGHVKS